MSSLIQDPQELQRAVGWKRAAYNDPGEQQRLHNYIAFQLAAAGLSPPELNTHNSLVSAFSQGIFESLKEKNRLLSEHRAPVDPAG